MSSGAAPDRDRGTRSRRRLELVYGKHAKLTVIKNKGVTVELRIPI